MKRSVGIWVFACFLAGCSSSYDIAQPSEDFVTDWNQSVPGEALHLEKQEANRYMSRGGDFSVWYSDGGWSLISAVGAEGDMVCTELLIRTTGMSFDRAQGLVQKTVAESSVRDGNLRFYMNRLGRGVSCSVNIEKPAG